VRRSAAGGDGDPERAAGVDPVRDPDDVPHRDGRAEERVAPSELRTPGLEPHALERPHGRPEVPCETRREVAPLGRGPVVVQ
jgi:hypothetical protein